MALRAGYKGFKKLLAPLKIIRPGTLGIDNDVLIPELNKTFFPRSEQSVLGAKNFNVYPYNYSGTQTFGGAVTVVFGDDGRITLNGTASANDNIIIHSRADYSSLVDKNPIILQKGTYKISRSTTGYDVRVVNTVSGSGNVLATLSGDSKEATFTLSDISQVGIIIDIKSGDEFSNKVIDLMISFDGGEFVPFAMTNRELTEKVQDLDTKITSIECDKTTAGTYTLSATVDAQGAVTYTWTAVTP